jgi:hypothetical protein
MFVVLCGILINESQKETNQSLCTESDITSYKRVCFKAMFFLINANTAFIIG